MINDLYQSIFKPRFVNQNRESKINTLNVNWTRERRSKNVEAGERKSVGWRVKNRSWLNSPPDFALIKHESLKMSSNKSLIIIQRTKQAVVSCFYQLFMTDDFSTCTRRYTMWFRMISMHTYIQLKQDLHMFDHTTEIIILCHAERLSTPS
jgi:hypothetical protein